MASHGSLLRLALSLSLACVAADAQAQNGGWTPMFDGKSLGGWRETAYTERGEVRVEGGAIVLGSGAPLTGINWTGPFPRTNYELRFEGARLKGSDFFAAVTFPAGGSFCTWVTGGWGGDIVGVSSIDGWDASDNETRTYFNFEAGRWYALRLSVTDERIQAWIDGKSVIDVEIGGRELSLYYGETKLPAPLGFASYRTTGAVRNIAYRLLRTPPGK